MFFPLLREALRAWSEAASIFVEAEFDKARAPEDPMGAFNAFEALKKRVFELKEWQGVLSAISDDPTLERQIGKPVGTDVGTQLVSPQDLGDDFVTQMFFHFKGPNDGFRIPEDTFDSIYRTFDDFLGSDEIKYDAVVAMVGLRCESHTIRLDPTATIELLENDDMLLSELGFSLLTVARDQVGRGIGEINLPEHYRHVFRRVISIPKVIGDAKPERAVPIYTAIEEDRRNCLRAIAATTFCRIIPWRVQLVEQSWRSRMLALTFRGPMIVGRYEQPGATISTSDEPVLHRAWEQLKHPMFAKNNGSVVVSLDRLAGLGLRTLLQDQLIDVMIACEAFFLARASGELRYRLAMNAAALSRFLGLGFQQAQVYDFMLKTYDVRSKIVHGDDIEGVVVKLGETDLDLNAAIYFAAEIVRRSVSWAFTKWNPGEPFAIDWKDMHFPESQPKA